MGLVGSRTKVTPHALSNCPVRNTGSSSDRGEGRQVMVVCVLVGGVVHRHLGGETSLQEYARNRRCFLMAKLRTRQTLAPSSGSEEARVENDFAKEKREAKADTGTTAFQ